MLMRRTRNRPRSSENPRSTPHRLHSQLGRLTRIDDLLPRSSSSEKCQFRLRPIRERGTDRNEDTATNALLSDKAMSSASRLSPLRR